MIILKNAKIYTCNEEEPWAEAIAINDDKIICVGSEEHCRQHCAADDIEIHDMGGRMILPGIIDGHLHPGWCSKSAWHIKLPWTEDVGELLKFVKDYAEKHPKDEAPFLYFEYYPTSMFDEKGPAKELLDSAVCDRPVLCQDFGEHLCWMNSKMLELLGVDKNTPDPSPLETFARDENGEPTGWVREMAWTHFAENMYEAINWRPPEDLSAERMKPFFDFIEGSGITAFFDAFIESDEQIKSIYEMDKAGKLHAYYDGSVRFWGYDDLPQKIAKLKEYCERYTTKHIKINTMKFFLDGTNESGNSASLHEHINDPGNYGEIMIEEDELVKCFMLCNKEGLDLHIHVVGDRGFRVACNAVERAQKLSACEGVRWVCQPVLCHCEVIDPEDMLRPAELGITINWSCHWAGGYFGEEAMNYYTEEKWRRMYRFNEIISSGALVAFSADTVTFYELHRTYPFFGMQVSATRVDPEFPLDGNKYPGSVRPEADAGITLTDLVKGYTINSAGQLRWNDIMGSLEAGKLANMIVLNKNIFDMPVNELKDVKVEIVIFDGKVLKGEI